MNYRVLAVGWLCFLMGQAGWASEEEQAPEAVTEEVKISEALIKFKPFLPSRRLQAWILSRVFEAIGRSEVLDFHPIHGSTNLYKIRLSNPDLLNKVLEVLAHEEILEYAEPNVRFHLYQLPNDPMVDQLWGMINRGQDLPKGKPSKHKPVHLSLPGALTGADIGMSQLWQEGVTGNDSIIVGVVDTGIDWAHPDLVENLYTNPGESGSHSGNGVDDDGNGYIDDVHGWNFAKHNNDSRDDQGHGTHVAGTIGAKGDNGIGVAGVNWNVQLMPLKFLDSSGGGDVATAVEAIRYAIKMGVRVLNNSWGGGSRSKAFEEVLSEAEKAGVAFVAAAGNESHFNDVRPIYPAGYPQSNVISVAASDARDQLALFSNWGRKTVHVAAPGKAILSTYPVSIKRESDDPHKDMPYAVLSGTSMATPHVSGIVALMLSVDPTLTPAEIRKRLIETSDPLRTLKRKSQSQGRVNAYRAVHNLRSGNPLEVPAQGAWHTEVVGNIESEHPYPNDLDGTPDRDIVIHKPGAKQVRVLIEKITLEPGSDFLGILDSKGQLVEFITGSWSKYLTEAVEGDTLTLRLVSDKSWNYYGYRTSHIQWFDGKTPAPGVGSETEFPTHVGEDPMAEQMPLLPGNPGPMQKLKWAGLIAGVLTVVAIAAIILSPILIGLAIWYLIFKRKPMI